MEHLSSSPPARRHKQTGEIRYTGFLSPDAEQHAAKLIEKGLEAAAGNPAGIDARTARLIAAALHHGYGTVLEHFAATGELNPWRALGELKKGEVELHRLPWYSALWDFLERTVIPGDDQPENNFTEPRPQIFVQARVEDDDLVPGGKWLEAAVPAQQLEDEMSRIARAVGPDAEPVVTATVGFYIAAPGPEVSPTVLSEVARLTQMHGEAYACLIAEVGRLVTASEFADRHLGTFTSVLDYLAQRQPERLAELREEHAGDDYDDALDNLIREVSYEEVLAVAGRTGVHVFTRSGHEEGRL